MNPSTMPTGSAGIGAEILAANRTLTDEILAILRR